MQPTYLPWSGYFNLIESADQFFYLDNAQYERGTWQHRNRILIKDKVNMLSLPVRRESLGVLIKDVSISATNYRWRKKHSMTIKMAYSKKPFYKDLYPVLDLIENNNTLNLCQFNILLIDKICELLKINTIRRKSSLQKTSNNRTKKLIELCQISGSEIYLSPLGSKDYLTFDKFETLSEISLEYQKFTCRPYNQGQLAKGSFFGGLSILDVIANLGTKDTKEYIKNQ